jgi:hypothetical protein
MFGLFKYHEYATVLSSWTLWTHTCSLALVPAVHDGARLGTSRLAPEVARAKTVAIVRIVSRPSIRTSIASSPDLNA